MANRIKESNITPGAVTSDKIAPGTVSASNISPGSITTTQIATDTIASSNIAPGTIANDRLANTGITINGTTIALGASGTIVAGTDWQSVVTADGSTATTASAGEGYFIDTTSAAHTVTLPSSPTQGDEVHIVDYAGTFGTNNVTVGRNGSNIDGAAADGSLATNRLNVRFVYIDSTKGWRAIFGDASENYGATYITATGGTVSESGDFKIHTFTGDGCFVVSSVGNPAGSDSVDYLVVAGGGGSGSFFGGGGGGGGFRESKDSTINSPHTASPLAATTGLTVTATTYPVTVGGGGSGGVYPAPYGPTINGTQGSNSVFSTITSTGGGGGSSFHCGPTGPTCGPGQPGGSGGGGGTSGVSNDLPGGSGNTPPVSPPQGNNGGQGNRYFETHTHGGGGGGATTAGKAAGECGQGGACYSSGGTGATTVISGSSTAYAGGGGGGINSSPCNPFGGTGGGGPGGSPSYTTGTAGSANTGGGGGGAGGPSGSPSGAGGKGIVIIRYKFQN